MSVVLIVIPLLSFVAVLFSLLPLGKRLRTRKNGLTVERAILLSSVA